jgi:hypothetical protein
METEKDIYNQLIGKSTQDFSQPKSIPRENILITDFKKIEGESELIQRKKEELALLTIEKQIEKLSKPDIPETNYFKEMMEQQKQHFTQLLEMNRQQNDIKLELEKLKIMQEVEIPEDDGGAFAALEMIKPFLPQILNNLGKGGGLQTSQSFSSAPLTDGKPISMNVLENNNQSDSLPSEIPQETKGGDDMTKEMDEYKKKIKSGEITEKQAYEDFLEIARTQVGEAAKLIPYKTFKDGYLKIKNGK